ncbi:MAG: hypothetical protein WBD05_02730 [Phycisphaerae bacterium]
MGRFGRRFAVVVLAGWFGFAASGCYLPHLGVWLFGPRKITKEVKAEHRLESERLVIVPYAGTDVLFTYPMAPIEISQALVNEIGQNLSDRVETIIHPVQVVRWQESTLDWPNMSLAEIGGHFQADTVLYVELERYTMVEERSANLFRGRAKARVQVVKVEAEHNPVYEATVEIVVPEDQPVSVLETSERIIRQVTNLLFARDVVRKFYDHKVEVKGGG